MYPSNNKNNIGFRLNILRQLMELETYITQNTPVPLTNKVIVDKDIVYQLIDNIREKLPDELKQCEIIMGKHKNLLEETQRERLQILESAHEEKAMLIALAKEEAGLLLSDTENHLNAKIKKTDIYLQAEEHRRQIIAQGEAEAREIVQEAYSYVDKLFAQAQGQFQDNISTVREGRSQIKAVRSNKRT